MHRNLALSISFILPLLTAFVAVSGPTFEQAQSLPQSIKSDEMIQALEKADSLLNESDKAVQSAPKKALDFAKSALGLSEKANYVSGVANSKLRLGMAQFELSEWDQSHGHFNEALKIFEELNDTSGIVLSHKWLGSVFRQKNDLEEALKSYFLAMELAEGIKFDFEIPKITQNIANIFLDQGQYDKAIEYFMKCCNLITSASAQSICLANTGFAYQKKGDNDSALKYYKRSIALCKSINDETCELLPLGMMTHIHLEQENFDQALKYAMEILTKDKDRGSKLDIAIGTNRIGQIYLNMENFPLAFEYFDQALTLAKAIDFDQVLYIHANLYLAAEGMRDFELALLHFKTFQSIKDSLHNIEKNKGIDELLAKFDTEKKEQEIFLLQKEKELQEAALASQVFERNLAFIGGLLALAVAITFGVVYQQKIRVSRQLAIKTEEVNEQKTKELLRENEINTINASIDGQEKERIRIAKELHDGIAGNLASIKLNLSRLSRDKGLILQPVIRSIDETYQEVRIISHHLIPPGVEETPFVKLIENYSNDIQEISELEINLNCHPEGQTNQLSNETKIEVYRIIQELVSNVIKHARAKSVDIQLVLSNDNLNLIVEDSGIGFDQDIVTNGIGIKNVRSRVDKLTGTIQFDSTTEQGTTVNINIPV